MVNRLKVTLIGAAILALILTAIFMFSFSKVALVGGGLLVLGFGVFRLLTRNEVRATPPRETALACGADKLRLVSTHFSGPDGSTERLQLFFNDRLVDEGGTGYGLDKFTGNEGKVGSGLDFWPAALRPDQLPHERLAPADSVGRQRFLWVNPQQFSADEFQRLARCCRAHEAAINRELYLNDGGWDDSASGQIEPQNRRLLSLVVYADHKQYAASFTFRSPGKNRVGGYDEVEIAAGGEVLMNRTDAAGTRTGSGMGERRPNTDTLEISFRDVRHTIMEAAYGPRPTLAELADFQNPQGRRLGEAFKLTETTSTSAP